MISRGRPKRKNGIVKSKAKKPKLESESTIEKVFKTIKVYSGDLMSYVHCITIE